VAVLEAAEVVVGRALELVEHEDEVLAGLE